MHETRNLALVIALVLSLVWSIIAWFIMRDAPLLGVQRVFAPLLAVASAGWLVYAFKFADKLDDHLKEVVGDMYYDVDGLSFMPMIRVRNDAVELCVYYQNRYENPVNAIIHLRPPEDSFVIRPGMRDVHFAFNAQGGDFGVIHQPISVPEHLRGDVVDVELAAATWYPRSHGTRLRNHEGMPCGSLHVDWGGAAFKSGVHEVSGEIDLVRPTTVHLAMPRKYPGDASPKATWQQERLAADEVEAVLAHRV